MKTKIKFILAAVFGTLAALLILLIKTVDVAATGIGETVVGLSDINFGFRKLTGVNLGLYNATEWVVNLGIVLAAVFAFTGLIQWIRRKNIFKVDYEILLLGCLYLCCIATYIFFEFCPLNYRPVLLNGETLPASSFPSSHTMTTCVIFIAAARLCEKYIRKENLCLALQAVCLFITAFTAVGRLISGVHWLTDILGGALIAAALLFLYFGMLDFVGGKIAAKAQR